MVEHDTTRSRRETLRESIYIEAKGLEFNVTVDRRHARKANGIWHCDAREAGNDYFVALAKLQSGKASAQGNPAGNERHRVTRSIPASELSLKCLDLTKVIEFVGAPTPGSRSDHVIPFEGHRGQ